MRPAFLRFYFFSLLFRRECPYISQGQPGLLLIKLSRPLKMKMRKYCYQGLFKLCFCKVEIQSSWEVHAKALVKIVNPWVFRQYDVKLKLYFATVNSVLINPCGLNIGSWKNKNPFFSSRSFVFPLGFYFKKNKPEICMWTCKQLHREKIKYLAAVKFVQGLPQWIKPTSLLKAECTILGMWPLFMNKWRGDIYR